MPVRPFSRAKSTNVTRSFEQRLRRAAVSGSTCTRGESPMPSGSNGWPLPWPDSLDERTGHEWQRLSEQVVAWRGEPGSARSATKPRHYVTSKLTSAENDKFRAEAREIVETARGKRLPYGCDVHHRVPLQLAHLQPYLDPDRLDNLIVITGRAAREARGRVSIIGCTSSGRNTLSGFGELGTLWQCRESKASPSRSTSSSGRARNGPSDGSSDGSTRRGMAG